MNPTSISNKVQLHNLTSHATTELVTICYTCCLWMLPRSIGSSDSSIDLIAKGSYFWISTITLPESSIYVSVSMSFAPESPKANNWAKASEGTGKPWCRLRLPDSDWNLPKKNTADYKPPGQTPSESLTALIFKNEFNATLNTGGPSGEHASALRHLGSLWGWVGLPCSASRAGFAQNAATSSLQRRRCNHPPVRLRRHLVMFAYVWRVLDDGPAVFPWLLLSLGVWLNVFPIWLKVLNLERFSKMVTPNHAPSLAKAAPPAVCLPWVCSRSVYRWRACCPLLLARSVRHQRHGTPHECGCWQLRSSHHVPGSVWDSRFDTSNRWHMTSHLHVALVQRQSSARPLPVAARLNSQAAPRRNR